MVKEKFSSDSINGTRSQLVKVLVNATVSGPFGLVRGLYLNIHLVTTYHTKVWDDILAISLTQLNG